MNDKTVVRRCSRSAGALAVVAAAVLATGCGASRDPANPGGTTTMAQELALAQCMRNHGAPNFPDPSASGGFTVTTTQNGPSGAVDIASPQIQRAYGACRHLLPGGGPSLSQLQQQEQQKLQAALPALLRYSRCMRSHGVPNFPDPPASGQGTPALPKGGIDFQSPQFLAAVHACQRVAPPGLHLTQAGQRKQVP